MNENAPVPAPKVAAELAKSIAARRDAIGRYYALLALYGPSARGTPAANATVAAIAARLASLGVALATDADATARALRVAT